MKRVLLVYFNAGGGHRTSAKALAKVLALATSQIEVQTINLVDMLDPEASFERLFGIPPEDPYNARLSSGLTVGMRHELKLLQFLIKQTQAAQIKRLTAYWAQAQPDLVVSLIPNFNQALGQSLCGWRPTVPFVTLMTDLVDHPPNFWIAPGATRHLICGTPRARQQAIDAGLPPEWIHMSSGMLLAPAFYEPPGFDRHQRRVELGLPPFAPVGVVMFGGFGSNAMRHIAQRLPDMPLIFLCGRNTSLAQALRKQPSRAPRVIVEFTDQVPDWLRLGDFFIGKPGPASVSEAIHLGLPVIVARNAWTMPQERYNTDWVLENGLGIVHRSFRTIHQATSELVADLPAFQARVSKMKNQAIAEVPALVLGLLEQHAGKK